MKTTLLILSLLLTTLTQAIDHSTWDGLLKKYVSAKGTVDYAGFTEEDKETLNSYILSMQRQLPAQTWSKNDKLAYWINVYNAVTVKLILDNYPVKSIQDLHPLFKIPGVNTVWHKTYFFQEEEKYSLDEIEHEILRKRFNEPRIHFAINCASKSCPPLRNEAYTAKKLEAQLQEQATFFMNSKEYNEIAVDKVQLSRIFSWFKSDFTKQGSLIDFINDYSKLQVQARATIDYLPYDWSLNE